MAALTETRNTRELSSVSLRRFTAASTIYAGSLVAVNSNGKAVPASDTAGLTVVGIAKNSASADECVDVGSGVFCLSASGSLGASDTGTRVFVADDQTVAKSTTHSIFAGLVWQVDTDGVWVDVGRLPGAVASHTHTVSEVTDIGSLSDTYAPAASVVTADPAAASSANAGHIIIVGSSWSGGTVISTGTAGEVYISTGSAWVKLG